MQFLRLIIWKGVKEVNNNVFEKNERINTGLNYNYWIYDSLTCLTCIYTYIYKKTSITTKLTFAYTRYSTDLDLNLNLVTYTIVERK